MKEEKIGRKTSPGFADPHTPVRLGEPALQLPVPAAPHPVASSPAAPVQAQPVAASLPAGRHATGSIPAASARPRSVRAKPLVEIEVLRERSRAPRPEPLLGCYEIWTQNHVYAIDARMRCLSVREMSSGEARTDHPFVGARLVGGQAQEDAMEMSYPLPRTGAHAVFEMRKGNRRHFTRTSAVERVVLRLRIVTISDGNEAPSWEDLIDEER